MGHEATGVTDSARERSTIMATPSTLTTTAPRRAETTSPHSVVVPCRIISPGGSLGGAYQVTPTAVTSRAVHRHVRVIPVGPLRDLASAPSALVRVEGDDA